MSRKYLKPGVLTAPVPPVLVTVGDMERSNVLTIGWTGILSTIPPRTYISVRPERFSYGILKNKKEFVINLATENMVKSVDYAGIFTGAKVDKFKECGFTKIESQKVSAPTIKESPLSLECRVVEVIPMGTHDVFIADIVAVSCDESMFDAEGKLRFDKAGLLAYAHGEYFALGEKLGSFGFSAKKNKKHRENPNLKREVNKVVKGAKEEKIKRQQPLEKGSDKNKKNKRDVLPRDTRNESFKDNFASDEKIKKEPFYKDVPKIKNKKNSGKSNKKTFQKKKSK